MSPKTVFVTGATSSQGGEVAHPLLSHGRAIHALLRDPASTTSQKLAAAGATFIPGDLNSFSVLQKAAHYCDSLLLLMLPPPDEIDHTANVLSAVKKAGIQKSLLVES